MQNGPARLFRVALAASLSVSALLFFVWSWRWPLVGDASLIHYIGWLIGLGWAPYREIGDMNMPGSYLIEIAAMHVFGMGDLAWRLFDFALMAAAGASFFVITRRAGAPSFAAPSRRVGPEDGWLAGLFAACLFILIHGRDGLAQGRPARPDDGGLPRRRDGLPVCRTPSETRPWVARPSGCFSGIALTIKPTALPLTVAQLALALYVLRGLA